MEYRFYPIIASRAKSSGQGGAFRAWTVARWMDQNGKNGEPAGYVERYQLRDALEDYGLSIRTRQQWIKDAKESGMLWVDCHDSKRYRYAGLNELARILEDVPHIGRAVILKDPREMFTRSWGQLIYDGSMAALAKGKGEIEISQPSIEDVTNIPARTQRHLLKQSTRVKSKRTFERLEHTNDLSPKEVAEYMPGHFKANGRIYKLGINRYSCMMEVCNKGRTAKVQREINRLVNLGRAECKNMRRRFNKLGAAHLQARKTGKKCLYREGYLRGISVYSAVTG